MFKYFFFTIFLLATYWLPFLSLYEKIVAFVVSALLVYLIDHYIANGFPFYKLMSVGICLTLSLGILFFIKQILGFNFVIPIEEKWQNSFIFFLCFIIFYGSFRVGATSTYFYKKGSEEVEKEMRYLVDTCAIIDGRLLEISKSGFIPSSFMIPEFVVRELQLISDSSNHEKRAKGRRGLDFLKSMKNSDFLSVQISADDDPKSKGVDNKLLTLAKKNKCAIITTDFNLVKVAQVEGVKVLNINYLASLIKPNLTVGDKLKVFISKKGNNRSQGVAFLPDDTMMIVENAESFVGGYKIVTVTSYNQNESGRMAFAKIAD